MRVKKRERESVCVVRVFRAIMCTQRYKEKGEGTKQAKAKSFVLGTSQNCIPSETSYFEDVAGTRPLLPKRCINPINKALHQRFVA